MQDNTRPSQPTLFEALSYSQLFTTFEMIATSENPKAAQLAVEAVQTAAKNLADVFNQTGSGGITQETTFDVLRAYIEGRALRTERSESMQAALNLLASAEPS